eukprot:Protomagalhaensia_wolfi_Nauph_80__6314@NODE_97_length_3755_cov_33_417653_g74_i0_p5_GENE_NODE_97_length_3755_cov_33_417653_g74_i0NODE_97_length_3755_cov_33_417653_g74_i0_p5_ORF_typecomplete_len105_score14_04DUF2585/PF10755_9/0_17_NODE_97_length_3755_cov_33_417653_g74_i034353749
MRYLTSKKLSEELTPVGILSKLAPFTATSGLGGCLPFKLDCKNFNIDKIIETYKLSNVVEGVVFASLLFLTGKGLSRMCQFVCGIISKLAPFLFVLSIIAYPMI